MRVDFVRSGERRYGVLVTLPGGERLGKDPAPGFDPRIPHDLVHYVLEAELGLEGGLYGRLARGGGQLVEDFVGSPRERARARRRQLRQERALRAADHAGSNDMERSERLAAAVDVGWRRRHGQRPDPVRTEPSGPDGEDVAAVGRVLDRLDVVATAWAALPVGGRLTFTWPDPVPTGFVSGPP